MAFVAWWRWFVRRCGNEVVRHPLPHAPFHYCPARGRASISASASLSPSEGERERVRGCVELWNGALVNDSAALPPHPGPTAIELSVWTQPRQAVRNRNLSLNHNLPAAQRIRARLRLRLRTRHQSLIQRQCTPALSLRKGRGRITPQRRGLVPNYVAYPRDSSIITGDGSTGRVGPASRLSPYSSFRPCYLGSVAPAR